jgi:thiamine-phosphate pyrophosphorylase
MFVDYSLYLIIDDSLCLPQAMPDVLKNMLDCGITCVQLRMKQSSSKEIIDVAFLLQKILTHKNIPLIINDDVEIAQYVNADGVHLGQRDRSIIEARQYLGENKIIGLSIENRHQALICKDYHVNYFGVGPIYPTMTKTDTDRPIGIAELKDITDILAKPIVAIGGINENNANSILTTGVAGIAVASCILASSTPTLAAKKIAALIGCKAP